MHQYLFLTSICAVINVDNIVQINSAGEEKKKLSGCVLGDVNVLAVGGAHQFAHFLPVAFEVSRRRSTGVTVFVPTPSDAEAVTLAADLYIGDVSSQVYEFVTRSRPCLFVNAHAAVWDGNPDYAMWKLGEVVAPDCDPLVAIDRAWASFPGYADVQKSRARATLDAIDWHEDGTALLRGDDPIVRAANEVADTVAMENGPQVVPGDRDGDAAGRGLLARAGFEAAQ